MKNIVAQGVTTTDTTKIIPCKIDVTGLQPNTYYYYEFEALGRFSQRGRTKTIPTGNVDNFGIAVVNCSNYSFGYFNVYDALRTRNDVDMVIHLGDYIYEDGVRQPKCHRYYSPPYLSGVCRFRFVASASDMHGII